MPMGHLLELDFGGWDLSTALFHGIPSDPLFLYNSGRPGATCSNVCSYSRTNVFLQDIPPPVYEVSDMGDVLEVT